MNAIPCVFDLCSSHADRVFDYPDGGIGNSSSWELVKHTLRFLLPDPKPVPEPATLALIGFCLAAIGFARKKKPS